VQRRPEVILVHRALPLNGSVLRPNGVDREISSGVATHCAKMVRHRGCDVWSYGIASDSGAADARWPSLHDTKAAAPGVPVRRAAPVNADRINMRSTSMMICGSCVSRPTASHGRVGARMRFSVSAKRAAKLSPLL